jgi:DNA repair exonuclease SbcCD ATPase subunit
MIPDAVLRRNRPTSPMPFVDSEPRMDMASPVPGAQNGEHYPNGHLGGRDELERRLERSDSITIDNDDLYDGLTTTSSPGPGPGSNQYGPPSPLPHPGMQRPPSRASPTTAAFGSHGTPPRPSREGVDIGPSYRNTIAIPQGELQLSHNGPIGVGERRPKSQMPTPEQVRDVRSASPSPSPSPRTPIPTSLDHSRSESPLQVRNQVDSPVKPLVSRSHPLKDEHSVAQTNEERANYLRELKARDAIIAEMKKKEQWWRTEVSLARKLRAKLDDDVPEDTDNVLMKLGDGNSEQAKLFDQLVKMKTELRKVKTSIGQQSQGPCQLVMQAERMRTAALQEAAYFKSKYTAIQSRQPEELASIETARSKELEDRLVHALSENETLQKKLQQTQKKIHHDQQARQSAEDRAHDANARAEDAQQAHTRAVEELSNLHTRTLQAEAQVRDSSARIADLTSQLNKALSTEVSPTALSDATIKISQLEGSSIKLRSELAMLKQKLAESEDENEKLRATMMEKESSLIETTRILEDNEIKIGMMKEAMIKKVNNLS